MDPPDSRPHSSAETSRPVAGASSTRRRQAPGFAIRPTHLAAVAVATLLLLLVGLPSRLDSSLFIDVDGRAVAVAPLTRLSDLARAQGLAPREGAAVDVAGDVLAVRGGEPGRLEIGGREELGDPLLTDGAVVTSRRGRDVGEPVVRRTRALSYETRTEGSGPVVAMVSAGKEGTRELFAGARSRRIVASFVLTKPVDAVFRRTRGLSPGQKAVALTFDDGPSKYTRPVLDVLASKGVSATFFMLGKVAAGNKGTVAAVRAAGHEVENHSWSHADLTKLGADGIKSEIAKTDAVLGKTRFLRPPSGRYNDLVATESGLTGHRLVLWDVDTRDWQSRNAEAIMAKVKAGARPGAIILMHDGGGDRSQTVAALSGVIDWLLQQGYAITTLRNLLG